MARTRIPQPSTGGVVKVPVVMQLEALECGAACLTMILAYYKKWIPLEQVRLDCGVSRDGSNAANVAKAARRYGLKVAAYRLEPETLKESGSFPCIIHWNFNHFVVLNGFKKGRAYLNDPAGGMVSVSMEEFDQSFTGICLTFEPGEDFEPSGKQKSILGFVKKRLIGLRIPMAVAVVIAVISSLTQLISPVFDRIFYDRLLTGQNPDWAHPFLYALGILYLIQIVVMWIQTTSNLKINGKINTVGSLSYMWKVLHLPMNFFSQRMTGDILSRQTGNAQIATTLVSTLSPLVINSAMMVFYLVVMIRYSWILSLLGISSVLVNMAVSQYIAAKRVNLTRVQSRDTANLYAHTVSGIQMIESIKSSGAEEGFFRKWAGYFAAVNASTERFSAQNAAWMMIPEAVSILVDMAILGAGLYLTICGQFTLGMITAFQGFFAAFISPATTLISAGQTIQEMRTQMERIEDVMEYPSDEYTSDSVAADGEYGKLSGAVDIQNVTFGYSALAKPLIQDFSMHIKPGSRVAFVGPSGCGKSTLAKLISGLYQPWSGDIRFDGKTIPELNHGVFTGSVAVVDQDIILFEDTIANNIKMWDTAIEDFEMILAARDAQIHNDITARPEGYRYRVTEGGKDFSGGQRQRLEIARVLAQDPTIIILDEATSALDAKTEYDVVKAIKDRGITCIVIAHRLSTIRDCDEIVVLDHGSVVERGTHESLMKLGGVYTQLIASE